MIGAANLVLYVALLFLLINLLALVGLWLHFLWTHRQLKQRSQLVEELIVVHQFPQRYQRLLRILMSTKSFRVESLWRRIPEDEIDRIRKTEIPNKLRRLVKRGPKWQKIRAMQLLGLLQDAQSIGLLRQMTAERDQDLALAAAGALGRFNDDSSARFILGLLSSRRHLSGSRIASIIEGMQIDLSSLFIEALASPDHKVRFWSATLAGRYPKDPVRAALVHSIQHPDANTRAAILDSLGKIGDHTCKAAITQALNDDVWYVRAHAALACGQVQIFESSKMLINALADPVWWVRHDASRALEMLLSHDSHGRVKEELLTNIDHHDPFARNMIAALLSNTGTVEELMRHFKKMGQQAEDARRLLVFIYDAGGAPGLQDDRDWQVYFRTTRKSLTA